MNGNMPQGMIPTPAGHQAELNYIYNMVEELGRQLSQNQRTLEEVVSNVGRVRSQARAQSLSNEELISVAGDDVRGTILFPLTQYTQVTNITPSPPSQHKNQTSTP